MSIYGNMVGTYSQLGKTFIIEDDNGNEIVGVITANEQVFDATPADVKLGKTFAYEGGVGVGTNASAAVASSCVIAPGAPLTIALDEYDYTKLQCIIFVHNNPANIVGYTVDDSVFLIGSSEKVATISRNADAQLIDLNINNDSAQEYEIRYFTYRE